MAVRPGEGPAQILRRDGMTHLRRQPVIHQHGADAVLRQETTQVAVQCLVARNPGSAVCEDDYRKLPLVGQVQIQLVPLSRVNPVGDIEEDADPDAALGRRGSLGSTIQTRARAALRSASCSKKAKSFGPRFANPCQEGFVPISTRTRWPIRNGG